MSKTIEVSEETYEKIKDQLIEEDEETYEKIKDQLIEEDEEIESDIKIVVLQRGWVQVGVFERDGADCKLYNASVIRKWGTSKGLGQLAKEGPLSETVLDKCHGSVCFDYLTVVFTLSCKESVWKNAL